MGLFKRSLTYASAGVDTSKQKAAIRALAGAIRFQRTGRGAPIGGLGHFAGLVDLGDQALAICTDGVGSKLRIAEELGRWDTVGIDCVAMSVNDCICVGAEPLAFVDYIATQRPDATVARAIGQGLDRGARQANVTLAGGETAILPEIVNGLDLAGACVGIVDKDKIVDGLDIEAGDAIIGLPSTGLHSNGYTLARRILEEGKKKLSTRLDGRVLGGVLLEPTAIYVRPILNLLRRVDVHGLANITGGGLRNIPRINPRWRYVIDAPLRVPKIFAKLQSWGKVEDVEMYSTFNMGLGFVAVVGRRSVDRALRLLKPQRARLIGRVEDGTKVVHEPLGLEYESKT